jgi:hypothetical protein
LLAVDAIGAVPPLDHYKATGYSWKEESNHQLFYGLTKLEAAEASRVISIQHLQWDEEIK